MRGRTWIWECGCGAKGRTPMLRAMAKRNARRHVLQHGCDLDPDDMVRQVG